MELQERLNARGVEAGIGEEVEIVGDGALIGAHATLDADDGGCQKVLLAGDGCVLNFDGANLAEAGLSKAIAVARITCTYVAKRLSGVVEGLAGNLVIGDGEVADDQHLGGGARLLQLRNDDGVSD